MPSFPLRLVMLSALLVCLGVAQVQPAPPLPQAGPVSHIIAPQGYQFPNGQQLIYEVEWRLWRAGVATLRMDAAPPEQRVTATADSVGAAALLYTVRDRFEAFFDPKTFCTRQLTKNTEEGFRRRETSIRFDYQKRKAMLEEKDPKSGKTKRAENDIPGCATDVVSGIFYVASLPLAENAHYTFPLNDGGRTVDVKVTVEARERIATPAGEFNTIRVQPHAASGVVKERGRIWIWYTDDAQRLPVQMRARMFWGTLTFRLARIEKK